MKLPGHRDNLKHAYASINDNHLFMKNISQLREEKYPPKPAAIIYFFMEKFFLPVSRCPANFTLLNYLDKKFLLKNVILVNKILLKNHSVSNFRNTFFDFQQVKNHTIWGNLSEMHFNTTSYFLRRKFVEN